MIKAIIVEDEELARQLVKNYLVDVDYVEVIGEYADGFSGAVAINRDKPNLVFLDIQLPRIDGFELLELLEYNPQIIFTTAYNQHAIKAFEQNATDYLLKPFSKERFLKALEKVRVNDESTNTSKDTVKEHVEKLTSNIPMSRIVVKDSKGINVIPINEILYFEAQDDYVMIYTPKGRFMKKLTLKHLEDRLDQNQFIRIHRSYIVNVSEIGRIEPYEKDSYVAILKNNARIKVSSNGYKLLKEKLEF